MHKVKYKQKTNSSKKNKTRRRNNTRRKKNILCKKGQTDESIRIKKLTEFVELNNKMYDDLNKKYEELQTKNDKKYDKKY